MKSGYLLNRFMLTFRAAKAAGVAEFFCLAA
jgi:hypothetical protein